MMSNRITQLVNTEAPRLLAEASLSRAVEQLTEKNVQLAVVFEQWGALTGLVSLTDLQDALHSNPKAQVKDVMKACHATIPSNASAEQAAEQMRVHRVTVLPVTDDGVVIGLLSARALSAQVTLEDPQGLFDGIIEAAA